MGWKDITEGDKVAKAKGARYIKSKTGTEGIEISFAFEEPSTGATEHLTWVGWLSEKARARTMETLKEVLGCNGNFKARDAGGVFTDKAFLAFEKECKLVVEFEDYTNEQSGETKAYPKIKWVNSLGGSSYAGVAAQETGDGLNALTADFLSSRPPVRNHAPQAHSEPAFGEDEIPF
jgi:hypothetical protein